MNKAAEENKGLGPHPGTGMFLNNALRSFRHKLMSHFKAEDGTISVEAVLWMPVYVFFIALIVDTSMMLHSRSVALRIIEDANRHAVIGYLVDGTEVTTRVSTMMDRVSENAVIDVTWGTDDIETVVRMPASDLQPLGLISVFSDVEITITSFNRFEI